MENVFTTVYNFYNHAACMHACIKRGNAGNFDIGTGEVIKSPRERRNCRLWEEEKMINSTKTDQLLTFAYYCDKASSFTGIIYFMCER